MFVVRASRGRNVAANCWAATAGRASSRKGAVGSDGNAVRGLASTPMPNALQMKSLRVRQPKELLQTDIFREVPPEDLVPQTLDTLAQPDVMVDPAKILNTYRKHAASGERPDAPVVIRAFVQLGFLFDPNSFFATADRQKLTSHRYFKSLAHDLHEVRSDIPDAAAPVLLYCMSNLEYRCAPLLPTLLDSIEKNLEVWRTEVLSLALHSVASLGLAGSGSPVTFGLEDGGHSRDYGHLCALLAGELGRRAIGNAADEEVSVQDWARAAFAMAMANLYDLPAACGSGPALPAIITTAVQGIDGREVLDDSGWAQFFLYQTLYCTDVERPQVELAIKKAIPMWMQERLHERWLDSIVLHAQPQGADELQRDVGASLKRTNTQALLNCSAGREWDEQHCWFAGFLFEPRTALECDAMLPLAPGHPRQSGWLAMKSRVLRQMGYTVVTIHRCFWDPLTEDQKDEQILRLRSQIGYVHDKELEKEQRRARQTPHTYKGLESKKKEWFPQKSAMASD